MAQAQVWVLVSSESDPTFIVGVYPIEQAARLDFMNLLRIQTNFPLLSRIFERQFGFGLVGLDTAALTEVLFEPNDYSDFLDEYISYSILPANVGQLFYFPDWTLWHEDNLYRGLNMILLGQTGRVFLRSDWIREEGYFLRDSSQFL